MAQPGAAPHSAEAAQKTLLEGPGMSEPLAAVLRPLGLAVLAWEHLRSHHRPGAGISALYRVEAVPRAGFAGTARASLHLQVGATTTRFTAVAGHTTVKRVADSTPVQLWVHPRDPVLPGLPWATSAEAVTRDLFGTGTGTGTSAGTGTGTGTAASLKLVAYRPLRRAVIRGTFQGSTAYLKVLQPGQADSLRQRLEFTAAAGLPVPPLLTAGAGADPAAGTVLAVGALPGRPLHRELGAPGPGFDPRALLELLAGLPPAALGLPRRPAWAERVVDYAAGAAVALPGHSERIIRCAGNIDAAVHTADPGPVVPTHGDFHGGNLLSIPGQAGQRISGLLDVDALGPGHRVDDLACFLGHLQVLAALNPGRPGLQPSAERCAQVFAGAVDPAALFARSAAVALTLVAGATARGAAAGELALAAAEELLRRAGQCS